MEHDRSKQLLSFDAIETRLAQLPAQAPEADAQELYQRTLLHKAAVDADIALINKQHRGPETLRLCRETFESTHVLGNIAAQLEEVIVYMETKDLSQEYEKLTGA